MANATRAVLGTVRRSAVLNTRHSVRSVPGRSVVVYEVARGFSGGQEFATSINVANEDSVTGVTELGVQPAFDGFTRPIGRHAIARRPPVWTGRVRTFVRLC